MPYRIEQTKEQTRESASLIRSIDLSQVRLLESIAKVRSGVPPPNELLFDIEFSSEGARVEEGILVTITRFSFWIGEAGTEAAPLVSVVAAYEATYDVVEDGFVPSPAQIDAFRQGNAIFNCWPYFREFAQTMVVRMGYPPPPIPFLRLLPKQGDRLLKSNTPAAPDQPAVNVPE